MRYTIRRIRFPLLISLSVVAALWVVFGGPIQADSLACYASGSTNTTSSVYGTNQRAQTFTIGADDVSVTGVDIGFTTPVSPSSSGTYTISIVDTSAGIPDKVAVLASATRGPLATNQIHKLSVCPTNITTGITWQFSVPVTLHAFTQYAIIFSEDVTGTVNWIQWDGVSSAGYSGGREYYSTDSGNNWNLVGSGNSANQFGIIGSIIIPPTPTSTPTPTPSPVPIPRQVANGLGLRDAPSSFLFAVMVSVGVAVLILWASRTKGI